MIDIGNEIMSIRHQTHGSFRENARISLTIKYALRHLGDPKSYTDIQAEALDLIATKLSRIASGQANFADHWIDIIGYATLVLKSLDQ